MDNKQVASMANQTAQGVQGGLIRPHHSKLLALCRILDCLVIYGMLCSAVFLNGVSWDLQYDFAGLAAVLAFVFFSEYNDVYGAWRGSPMRREALRIMVSWMGVIVALAVLAFFSKTSTEYSRMAIGSWFILAPLAVITLHILRRLLLGYFRGQGKNSRAVAIVGANEMGERLSNSFLEMPWLGYKFMGYYDDRASSNDGERCITGSDVVICGDLDALFADAKAGKIDIIYITLPLRAEQRIKTLIKNLANSTVSVNIVPDFFVFDLLHARWSTLQGLPVISIFDTPFQMSDGIAKRAEDLILGTAILSLISIPMIFIALAVKITSPGPILFKQKRYGVHGEEIDVYKFRSMSVMDNGAEIKQATKNDSRVTKLGAFLRRTSLDELPQFFNVLSGKMSIVGPRPHAVAHNEYYREQIQGYMLRHKVKPGITGLAQINGLRGETETIEKMAARVQFDLDYIRHWSLSMDLKIIFQTIYKEFLFSKAY
jgi:putative colanic acid biosynthesis UDP-glucose lipid carrier transferase